MEQEHQRELVRLIQISPTIYEGVVVKPVPLTIARTRVLRGPRPPASLRVDTPVHSPGACGPRFSIDGGGGARRGDRVLVLGRRRGLFGFQAYEVAFKNSRDGADLLRRVK